MLYQSSFLAATIINICVLIKTFQYSSNNCWKTNVTMNRRNDDKRRWTCTRRDLVEKNMNLSKKDVPCIVVQTPLDDSAISHVWTHRQLQAIRISIQVTSLVVTKVQSEHFRLVTERRHYNTCPIYGNCSSARPVLFFTIPMWYRVPSMCVCVLCKYSTLRHNLHPLGYLCAKFRFCGAFHCWASSQRKLAQSITHSSNLFDLPGTKAYR